MYSGIPIPGGGSPASIVVGSLLMAYPLIYALTGSFSNIEDSYASPWLPIPRQLYMECYTVIWNPGLPFKDLAQYPCLRTAEIHLCSCGQP
jgi:ABC-type glycerol-3-phosphate transport system permease component